MDEHIAIPGHAPEAVFGALCDSGGLGDLGRCLESFVRAWAEASVTTRIGSSPGESAVAGSVDGGAAGADAPGGAVGFDAFGGVTTGIDAMSDDGLMRVTAALEQLGRRVDALKLQCASAISQRSAADSRHDGLAGQLGYPTPERLIAAATGTSMSDAVKLIAVAKATEAPQRFGEAAPRYPRLAEALGRGSLTVDAVHRISSFLDQVRLKADPAQLEDAESVLIERALTVGVDSLSRYFKHLEAELDPGGVKPREDELYARRTLRIWEGRDGLIHLRGSLDPLTAAPIKLAVETLVSSDLHAARKAAGQLGMCGPSADVSRSTEHGASVAAGAASDADRAMCDVRSIEQMAADALADIARLATSAVGAPPALRSATVVARIDLDDLRRGTGFAEIDGIHQPISTVSARELVAAGAMAPMIVRGGSEVLDLGRRRRLFTKAQRIALAERDGGCAHPGCARPIAHTQAHHIRGWDRDDGPTDLENGVLLCAFHHHCVHDGGWRIVVRDGRVWFIPPAHIDAAQRPRPGQRATRHELHDAARRAA